jgi:Mrp family chromosome partitioning ATPase
VVLGEQRGVFAERFRHFALRVRRELERRATRTVLITSAVREDGKTTTASNLTLALASMSAGRRNALVELDLRKPGLSQALGVERPSVGFEAVLRGDAPLQDSRLQVNSALDLFLVGRPITQAHEVLASAQLGIALGELSRRYDTIVLDTPPVLVVPDVSLIVSHVEACVTVARIGATPRSAFRSMLEELPGEKIIGAFLNSVRSPRRFGRYGYDYYHGYDEDSAAG